MENRKIINVACAIIVSEGKVLVAQRSEKMSLPLKWEFPGGKLNEDENAENCILRELKEELNINVRIIDRFKDYPYNYENVSINLIPFITEYIDGQLILHEHKNAKWVNINELTSLDWAAADIPIVIDFINSKNA